MIPSNQNHRASEQDPSASAWMDLSDEGLTRAMDAAFDSSAGDDPSGLPSGDSSGDSSGGLSCGPSSREAASLVAFGSVCRTAFGIDRADTDLGANPAESEEIRARRVAARVLARTTRGDRETGVIDFVSEKLRRSPLLRVAAAILLVQVTVVPLIAWHLTQLPQPDGFLTGIEPPPEVFEQDLPRQREPIEEVETRHAELLGLGSSLSAAILNLGARASAQGEDLSMVATNGPLDRALSDLARVASDARYVLGAVPVSSVGGSMASEDLLLLSLDLEARLIAFDNARRSVGLSASIQALSDALSGADSPDPTRRALASMALLRASSLNLAVPDGPLGGGSVGNDWLTELGNALAGSAPSPAVDGWRRAVASR